jgi:mycothiol system anti-sigma-R factor
MTTITDGINCREAMQQLYDYLDGELSAEKMQVIRQHIETCKPCYAHAEFERDLLLVIAAGWKDVSASQQLRERIRARLEEAGFSK